MIRYWRSRQGRMRSKARTAAGDVILRGRLIVRATAFRSTSHQTTCEEKSQYRQ